MFKLQFVTQQLPPLTTYQRASLRGSQPKDRHPLSYRAQIDLITSIILGPYAVGRCRGVLLSRANSHGAIFRLSHQLPSLGEFNVG